MAAGHRAGWPSPTTPGWPWTCWAARPGIFSARWAGRHGDDAANLELLLAQLADIAAEHRGAALRLRRGAGHARTAAGVVERGELRGTLLAEPRGNGGFGYDPILQPAGMDRSCAELTPEEKNAISHRGHAFRALLPAIVAMLWPEPQAGSRASDLPRRGGQRLRLPGRPGAGPGFRPDGS